jgi:geranylgeranyl reductase family protein
MSPALTAPDLPRTADVVVVGAGPAGCAAAITLSRAGRDVVVVDKARFPRDKCCGDGLTAGALRSLEQLGVDPQRVPSWRVVRDVVVRGPSGRTVHLDLPRDPGVHAAVARRHELDAELVRVTRAAGATVIEGVAVTAAKGTGDRVVLEVGDGARIDARYAVGADGAWSLLRKLLGAGRPGYRGDWHAFRQYVTGVGPAARDDLHVVFEPDLLPGYFWSFPVGDGGANIGFGIHRDQGIRVAAMKDIWPALLARPHVRELLGPDARPEGPHRAWPIPARIGHVPLAAGRALFVGDAAAATDPLTGEGIAQALETGIWAAQSIFEAGPFDALLATHRYEARVERGLVPDHRLAERLSRVLAHRRGAEWALTLAGASSWTRRNFARWLFEDYPRAALLTPARWRRDLLHGPGAYAA